MSLAQLKTANIREEFALLGEGGGGVYFVMPSRKGTNFDKCQVEMLMRRNEVVRMSWLLSPTMFM